MRKGLYRAILVLGMALVLVPHGEFCGVLTSARNFQKYFRALDKSQTSLNPVERFVFSLILANTKTPSTVVDSEANLQI